MRRSPLAACEPVAQLDRRQRVEAELLEGPAGVDRGRRVVTEHGGDLAADEVEHERLALGGAEAGEPRPQ